MIGLPGQSEESSMEDIDRLAYVKGPRDMELRIYPCLVIEGTPLAEMVHSGAYVPLSLEECVRRSGKLLQRARSLGFTILRVGLLETTSLAKSVIGGPYHPALGELARAEALALELTRLSPTGPWVLPSASTSLLLGHGGFGLRRLARMAGMSPDAARSLISWR
jgi:histone acetyltransferase (RNA polymerase elongator complex component)